MCSWAKVVQTDDICNNIYEKYIWSKSQDWNASGRKKYSTKPEDMKTGWSYNCLENDTSSNQIPEKRFLKRVYSTDIETW